MGPKTIRLFAGTALRQWLDSAASVLHVLLIVLAGVSLLLLFLSRLFALIPSEYFDLRSETGILPLALAVLVLSAIMAHRPTASQTARLVDTRMGTKDIFLTTARIDGAYGDFKPIVLSQAEKKAVGIRPVAGRHRGVCR
jgi:hypothetical protein